MSAADGGGLSEWFVVIPVKGAGGKSRLAVPARERIARAIALDTIEAVLRATRVRELVVVSSDDEIVAQAPRLGASVRIADDPGGGLNHAIATGLAGAGSRVPRAALLGDLPALDPAELDAALSLALAVPRGLVPDAERAGTTMLTAGEGEPLEPLFGTGSRIRHADAGYSELALPATSSLRRDVDTIAQLSTAAHLGLGPRTAALVAALERGTL